MPHRQSESEPQPTLTDGVVVLRPWRDDDVEPAVAGHDDEMAHWLGRAADAPSYERHRAAIEGWRAAYEDGRSVVAFAVEAEGALVGSVEVRNVGNRTGSLTWTLYAGHRGHGYATRAVRLLTDYAIDALHLHRVEAEVDAENQRSLRVATRAGLRREGVKRVTPGQHDRAEATEVVVLARLATDPPITDAEGFRALLNSFLPRKRAISQLLVRDPQGRVLLCQLTYKKDWDLPGGVVEVGESPQLAVEREFEEELGLSVKAGSLVLTDWLPPWGGWDDALCLVFDGGEHDPELLDRMVAEVREIRTAEFCTLEQVHERAADFTARRIEAALANLDAGSGPSYSESGRP